MTYINLGLSTNLLCEFGPLSPCHKAVIIRSLYLFTSHVNEIFGVVSNATKIVKKHSIHSSLAALKKVKQNKLPWNDGLSVAFYVLLFWPIIGLEMWWLELSLLWFKKRAKIRYTLGIIDLYPY